MNKKNINYIIIFGCILTIFLPFMISNSKSVIGGWCTDHISHISSTYAAFFVGFDLLKIPPSRIFEKQLIEDIKDSKIEWNKDEIYTIGNNNQKKMLLFNWSHFPRPYPAGVWLYHLPEGLGLALGIDYIHLSLFAVIKYGLISFFCFFFLLKNFLVYYNSRDGFFLFNTLSIIVLLIIGYQTFYWSYSGIYDVIAILTIFLSIKNFIEQKYLNALLFFTVGVFFHFRALWYLPIAIVSLLKLFRFSTMKKYSKFEVILKSFIILSCGLISLISLINIYTYLSLFPNNNIQFWSKIIQVDGDISILTAMIFLVIVAFKYCSKLLGVLLFSVLCFLHCTPQLWPWHSLFILPLFGFGLFKGKISELVMVMIFYLIVAFDYYTVGPFDPFFLKMII